jgi:hypothetical protein
MQLRFDSPDDAVSVALASVWGAKAEPPGFSMSGGFACTYTKKAAPPFGGPLV